MLDRARGMRLHLTVRWCCAAVPMLIALGVATAPAAAAPRADVRYEAPSPAEGATLTTGSVAFEFTFNRRPAATQSLTCTLAGPTPSSGPCDAPVASGSRSRSGASYSGLVDGAYAFTVAATSTDGGTASETRHFTVAGAVSGSGAGAITTGSSHACAVTASGAARCWGWNVHGQLGNGTHTSRSVGGAVVGSGAASPR